jgi:trehalose synthase
MRRKIEDYIPIVNDGVIAELHKKAKKLLKKHILHINSTFMGGGVAEILYNLVPMMNDAGVLTGWRVLHGNAVFYEITKKFHNGLQGEDITVSDMDKRIYAEVNESFSTYTHVDHDCVIVHDPQPLPFIVNSRKQQPWIWRCHIDLSAPNKELWDFLKRFMLRYDVIIVSSESYKKKDLPVDQRIIAPAIDPLASKNIELPPDMISKYLKQAKVPLDKPIITQVSRMDKWKDPEGVLEVYEKVRKKVDCRLLYCYNLATDDPEGMEIYSRIFEKTKDLRKRKDVLFVLGNNEFLVNAIQTHSDVIVQKSTREGFCLSVTEALWKGTPVVGSNIGGIPQQIVDGKSGYLADPHDYQEFADKIVELLKNRKLAQKMGQNAKEFVRRNFLITRLMGNYLDLIYELM